MFGGTDKPRLSVVAPGSGSVAKKHVDKVSFAGIFNKILINQALLKRLFALFRRKCPVEPG